ncbi:MAG TPA: hypothetical protein PK079_20780 [Leptospiraceae bacterium]|nr:hypothetical protein [Leptospiraceae bacterium]HMW04129.1 hypothetical protein [Leptospiraceae bacterium]HMX30804.1 hypothetical protein [Leptospiraceae bacterium]HMY30122.1 hypothetical protein [Leptospiraceae bacterium]HMZ64371.1 hypothetical protein [Leptospiraceae bacterium]
MIQLKTDAIKVFESLSIPEAKALSIFGRITDCYSESHRSYHNLRHIREMLETIFLYKENIVDYSLLYIACLYHDIFYDTHANDNEEKSYEYLKKDFSEYLSSEQIEKCGKLILGTKTHQFLQDDFDNKIFLDSDLLILGRERNRYIEYMDSIRKEYDWVEREIYKTERSKILKKFLERNRIYFTDEIYSKYEKEARENLNFEIEMYFQK